MIVRGSIQQARLTTPSQKHPNSLYMITAQQSRHSPPSDTTSISLLPASNPCHLLTMSEPQLAPPGAGLPKLEAFAVRNIVFPFLRFKLKKDNSIAFFKATGQGIMPLVRDLSLEDFTKPVLINRLPGLEDSSRNWSVEQTLEHIQVVTAAALYIIKKLEANQPLDLPIRTQDVKPSGGIGLDRIRAFDTYLKQTPEKIAQFDFTSEATHPHPWFGDLKSLDWLRLIAFHQDLHRKQIARIVTPPPC